MNISYTLNIGLQTSKGLISASAAREALHRAGAVVVASNVLRSDTEPTLIARVQIALGELHNTITRLCEVLDQDCIAVVSETNGQGILLGPRAAAWGDFNPDYFLTLSGRRLSDHKPAKAADAYQGHLADGSGVQAHSAGGLYPYVVVAQDRAEGLRFYAQAPDGAAVGPLRTSYGAAADDAVAHRDGAADRAVESLAEQVRRGVEAAKAAARCTSEQVAPTDFDDHLTRRGFTRTSNAAWWAHPDGRLAHVHRNALRPVLSVAWPEFFIADGLLAEVTEPVAGDSEQPGLYATDFAAPTDPLPPRSGIVGGFEARFIGGPEYTAEDSLIQAWLIVNSRL